MSEWKPGDVASFNIDGKRIKAMVGNDGRWNAWDGPHRSWLGREWTGRHEQHSLVVIDPEDASQVARLADLVRDGRDDSSGRGLSWGRAVTEALREFAQPSNPKPDEPLGLGAVVEDEFGCRWVRALDMIDAVAPWKAHDCGQWGTWDGIDPVRVLSEGIQPDEPLADWERDLLNGSKP